MLINVCRCTDQSLRCTLHADCLRRLMFVSTDLFTHRLSFAFISGMQITLIVPPGYSFWRTMTITNVFISWRTLLTTYTEAKNKVRHVCHTVINVWRLILTMFCTQRRCQIKRWNDFTLIIMIRQCNTRHSCPSTLTRSIDPFHTLSTETRCLVYVDQDKVTLGQRRWTPTVFLPHYSPRPIRWIPATLISTHVDRWMAKYLVWIRPFWVSLITRWCRPCRNHWIGVTHSPPTMAASLKWFTSMSPSDIRRCLVNWQKN